ncbi:hypothetical protein BS47DRAFT_727689 [Hydnum rufescens UP504]|uniref:USP domain-containing protein n=1 Tax=Hydnum rufescens UP504 TaxID=1448309 RepID=A0A9P6DYE8_9AGAM|nr:hypothetical protein BS47DRAFT_727689 [Hydnum rufescens UP504]
MTIAQDDDLQRAMEASLNSSYNEHSDELWVPGRTRVDKTCTPIPDSPVSAWAAPVAIRASNGRLQFAALLIQALYAVPQLRDRLMEVTLDPYDTHERLVFNEGQNDHVRHFFELQRVFCMLDYTQRAHIEIDYLLSILGCQVPTRIQRPEKQSLDLLNNVCDSIESALMAYYAVYQIKRLPTLTTHFLPHSPPVFHILLKPTQYRNDLHSCLQYFFTEDIQRGSQKSGKAKAKDAAVGSCRFMQWQTPVLIFRLFRDPHESSAATDIKSSSNVSATTTTAFVTTASNSSLTPGSGTRREKPQPEPFKFPSVLQMDRWYINNASFTNDANYEIRQLRSEAVELEGKLARLLTHNDHDNLASLQSALYYVENVASRDTEERKAAHAAASSKLRAIIERIQQEIQKTKVAIRHNLEEQSRIYEETTGELEEEFRYDLRAVLMHNGSYGPKNVYAYVKSSSGEWWKSVYDVVTKVRKHSPIFRPPDMTFSLQVTEETVLTDRAGLYLNSGPYMLFYSRVTPEWEIDGDSGEPSWPPQAIPPVDMKLSWHFDFLKKTIGICAKNWPPKMNWR